MQIHLIIILILTTLLFLNAKNFAKFFELFDVPNEVRKIHSFPIPKVGGVIIFFGILLYFFSSSNYIQNIDYIIFVSFFFLIGLLDDLNNLSSSIRLLVCFIFIFIFLFFNPELRINDLLIFGKDIDLNFHLNFIIIIFITSLCIMLLQHAINMIDGINGLCALFVLINFLYFKFNYFNDQADLFYIFLILIFIFFNLLSKTFLGNSGSYLLSSILGYKILLINSNELNLTSEKIFLVLLIPGVDMLRLFIVRIWNKKNPFRADSNHLHHLLLNYFNSNQTKTLLVYLIISFVPILISSFNLLNDNYLILISILVYVYIIYKLKFLKVD